MTVLKPKLVHEQDGICPWLVKVQDVVVQTNTDCILRLPPGGSAPVFHRTS